MQAVNRRRFERFSLRPMYTAVTAQERADGAIAFEGHAYDISEGGIRFELDEAIMPGTPILLHITLPGLAPADEDRRVSVHANVIWIDEDLDEPGPVRMAAAFTRFAKPGDRERLLDQLASGRFARAA